MDDPFQVFISHFTGEKKIADELTAFIREAFPSAGVFQSSDKQSIQTADGQYDAILRALRSARVVIVLLSSDSAKRPWVAFECGFATAGKFAPADNHVRRFTWLVRGARAKDIDSPFQEMQLRPIGRVEIEHMLVEIEKVTGTQRQEVDIDQLLQKLEEAESALPNVRLELEPYMETDQRLGFKLWYMGHKPLRLQRIIAGIPKAVKNPAWTPLQKDPVIEEKLVDGVPYLMMKYNTPDHPVIHHGSDPQDLLPPLFRFSLNRNMDFYKEEYVIRYRIEITEYPTEWQRIPMSRLLPRATGK